MGSNVCSTLSWRTIAGRSASALAIIIVLFLTACGTSSGTSPSDGLPQEDPYEDLVGEQPAAIAVFVTEGEADVESPGHLQPLDSTVPGFETGADLRASGGAFIEQPSSIGAVRSGSTVAEIAFDVAVEGTYTLWVRVFAPAIESDATYLGFNGVTRRVYAPETGAYLWLPVASEDLPAGPNEISLAFGEPSLRLDLFAVVKRSDVGPNELESLVRPPRQGDHAGPDPKPSPAPEPGPAPTPGTRVVGSLRGDPGFRPSSLSGEAAKWYAEVLEEIADGSALRDAGRDDLYYYGRTLHAHVQSVLTVFRLTGDLTLLDHVDEITERMRDELRDEWRGTRDGSDGTKDGYLNWVYRYDDGDDLIGKDVHRSNEMKTHAMIATVAYALELNRDLASPGGRAYGDHADFWKDYLVDHFEAKWREREDVPTAFPIFLRPHTHTYYSWMKWHYYMGLLTGESGYRNEAERMASVLRNELREVDTRSGTAYVWARSVLAEGGGADYLHPTTYARYMYGDIVEFHLEGFAWYGSTEHMVRFARTFTELVMDEEDPLRNGFAEDVGGGSDRGGIDSDPAWGRLTASKYRISSYAFIGAWDSSHRIDDATEAIFDARGRESGLLLAAAEFFSTWHATAAGTTTSAAAR